MRKKLLFVTKGNDDYEEGFSYVLELSEIVKTDITILIIYDKPLMKSLEDRMAAIAFAEAGETKTAKEVSEEWLREMDKDTLRKTESLIIKYCINTPPLKINYKTAVGDIVSNIKKVVEHEPAVDMVLLSPSLSGKGVINTIKLLKNISKPIVSLSKLSNANT